MYTAFNQIAYPLVDFSSGSTEQVQALRSALVDFKIYVAGDSFSAVPKVTLVSLYKATEQPLKLLLELKVDNIVLGSTTLTVADDSYATQEFVRYYFDSDDWPVVSGYKVEGYICLNKAQTLFQTFAAEQPVAINVAFEPSTVVVLSNHRVHQITCRSAKPLLQQTPTDRYGAESLPVLGDVKLVAGNNCTISVLPDTKTIIIGAQQGANDSGDELCGVWAEKVSPKDILCDEAIYSISGVDPDSNGNIDIKAETPLVVSSFTKMELEQVAPAFIPVVSQFPDIIRFIYVGLPQSAGNASVFNCDTQGAP